MSATMIQQPAPNFKADAVMANGEFGEISLSDYKDNKYVVLFFYPLDFTFVCPSELIAFSNRIEEFENRGVQVIGCSVDSKFSHFAWRKTPVNEGGIGEVKYPLISDMSKSIARDYGVLLGTQEAVVATENGEMDTTINGDVALRGTFLIDKAGLVRHSNLNDLPLGRNVDEVLRLVDALQFTEEHGEVCPAGWNKGAQGMKPNAAGVASYLAENASKL